MAGTISTWRDAAAAGATRDMSALPVLAGGCLHEIHHQMEDGAAATAFALAAGRPGGGDAIFLLRGRRRQPMAFIPMGDGLRGLGIDPARLVVVDAGDDRELLRAGLDAARCPGVGAVLLDMQGRFPSYDLTASRRLLLAAERSGVRVILLRGTAEPRSSAAWTRWTVASAPSVPWDADAPGWPAIEVELLRCRGGGAGARWRLEWIMDQGVFRDAADGTPLPGSVVPLAPLRTGRGGHGGPGDGAGHSRAA